MKSVLWILFLVALLYIPTGCMHSKDRVAQHSGLAIPIENNERKARFIILGFGIVSVEKPESTSQALVTDQTSIGLSAGSQPGLNFGIGYQNSTVTTVPANESDIYIDVSSRPFGKLEVSTQSHTNQNQAN